LGFGLTIYGVSTWSKKGNRIAKRLDQFIVSEDQLADDSNANRIILREIKGSLFSRTIINWLKKVFNLLKKFTPEKMAVDMEHKLTIAGNPANMHAGEYLALRCLVVSVGITLAFLLNRDFNNINMNSILYGIVIIVVCLFLPEVWLNGCVRSRQDEIRRGLPDALDVLSVCAGAGLGFDQSLQKISTYWDTELGHELKRATQEMKMGSSRAEALKNMRDRLDVDDFTPRRCRCECCGSAGHGRLPINYLLK
jgi:tight adherence protein C